MKRLTLLLLLLALCLAALTGCKVKEQSETQTSNSEVKVQLLFTHDGVKVYRFNAGDRWVYYTDARGKTAWDEQHGKVTERVEVALAQAGEVVLHGRAVSTGMLIALAGTRLQNKETFKNMCNELRKNNFRTHSNN